MALTKIEMISKLCEDVKLDRKKASESVEKIIEVIKSALASDGEVLISGFGKFSVNQKNERKGRNPATDEALMLPARKVVVFKYSGKLRDRMNGKKGI
ncbi:MAG: integration host factor subunit alpha [Desulfosalsimonadaceae bacterium]